jgi:hypothetical protein
MMIHPPRRSVWPHLLLATGVLWALAGAQTAEAADFRVHTTVVADGDPHPVATNLTIFLDRSIYDFPLGSPGKATVFDTGSCQFTLLDQQRGIQCFLRGPQLLRLIAAIQQAGAKTRNAQVQFAANPVFEERFEPDSLRLTLNAGPLSYTAVGRKPEVTSAPDQYREFADWFARLNATQSAMPPAARLQLNEAIWKRKLVPDQVSRRIPGKTTYHSRQSFTWCLSKEDLRRVEQARKWGRICHQVSLDEFRRASATASSPNAPQ